VVQQALPKTDVKHVIVATMGDLLGFKGHIVNLVVRKVKKLVPAYALPQAISYKSVLKQARNTTLTTQLDAAHKELATCTARNEALYTIGNEVVDAYAHVDMGTIVASRQPFAASARVKLENAAQGYGDRLYEQRYRPAAGAAQP